MKKTLVYTAISFILTIASSIYAGYTSNTTNKNNSRVDNAENNLQSPTTRWQIVKHVFQLHIPRNITALSQLIIDTPSTVAVSNDIDVLAPNGQKINTNVSVDGRRIIIDFPEKVIFNTKILIGLNKVKQPTAGPDPVYSLSAKVVGSDSEIPVGVARFSKF